MIGGCNDCHTAGYAPSGGKVPESQWLLGDALGWHGPWGTTYATNLRLYMQDLTEEQWVKKAKALNARPPMPWFNVRAMTSGDLRAMYRYIRSLGPVGKPAPAYLPPDKTPPRAGRQVSGTAEVTALSAKIFRSVEANGTSSALASMPRACISRCRRGRL